MSDAPTANSAPLELKIIIGSTRDGRASDLFTPWLIERAGAHGAFNVEVLDLRDWPLPLFQETMATIGDIGSPTYSDPIMRAWNDKIKSGDTFVFVTPEYNHSVPGVLKNAIDSVFVSWGFRNKVCGYVGYSGSAVGAARAVEHLVHIANEVEMVSLRNSVLIGGITQAFRDNKPVNPLTDTALDIMLDDMAWWGRVTRDGRAGGMLPPGTGRMRAAMTALAKANG
ncbi:MAG: NADPH-dependent FMN reductase [Acidimicrobiia bacterium]